MRELRCGLKKTGEAVLLVPVNNGAHTFEDSSIKDPGTRSRLFGQRDHVRRYGADYVDRLREAGFEVETLWIEVLATEEEADRMVLYTAAAQRRLPGLPRRTSR